MRPADEIHVLERDYCLSLDHPQWPPGDLDALRLGKEPPDRDSPKEKKSDWLAGVWNQFLWPDSVQGGFLTRELSRRFLHDPQTEVSLHEAVLPFPSVPLFGTQRKMDYQIRMRPIHQHTLRLLTAHGRSHKPEDSPIQRVFLLFNGLNEIQHLNLYYDLAALIIDGRRDVACLLCPSPGHLSRYPMVGDYAEKPLQRFINDPGELFRQYLRFMLEIQWLLSTLVSVSSYPVAPGIQLLAEGATIDDSRCDPRRLSTEIAAIWRTIHEHSLEALRNSGESEDLKALRREAQSVPEETIYASIVTLRRLIGWRASEVPLADLPRTARLPPPLIHVVGYSLGAYLAQSVFFGWPFAVSSCTTVCAGAALRDLRPVRLAHEEEWRSVTHGLNYELESGMLEGRIRVTESEDSHGSIFGIPSFLFSSLFQVFNDVFLQDPYGSYRTRVSEFSPRLLFVVGGNDPIVSTKSVLEASPPEGINLIEIANLSHFLARARGEWSSFWLPTVTRVIFSLAEHSETLASASVLGNRFNEEATGLLEDDISQEDADRRLLMVRGRSRGRPSRLESEPLDSEAMLRTLIQLVETLKDGKGFLFVLRNQIPFALMGPRLLHRRGGVPHYEDSHVREFWQQLQLRRETMVECASLLTLVLPERQRKWFVRRPSILSAKVQPVTQETTDRDWLREIWEDFLRDWQSTRALFRFRADFPQRFSEEISELERYELEGVVRKHTSTPPDLAVINSLPDIWLSLSGAGLLEIAGDRKERESANRALKDFALDLYQQQKGLKSYVNKAPKLLERLLASEGLRIIRISAADSNPRFLGEEILDPRTASELIIHSALALGRSDPWAPESEKSGTGA